MTKKTLQLLVVSACLLSLPGCAPEVGSERWCETLDGKSKGDWTIDETADYVKHCVLTTRGE